MLSKVTAGTITERQINVARKVLLGIPRKTSYHRAILADCAAALDGNKACRESIARFYNKMNGTES
jgi:hypothetical protein